MRWAVALLLSIVGVYMTFDGIRALTVGDYLTPSAGEHQGELGPWSRLIEAVGIPPRATAMKSAFVVIGMLHLTAALAVLLDKGPTSGWLAMAAAITGLWYLPFGTVADLAVLALVASTSMRPWT